MKTSIGYIKPRGSWYPNQKLKSAYSSKFSGSPAPKQMSNLGIRVKNSIYGDFGEKSSNGAKSFMLNPQMVPRDLNSLIDKSALNSLSAIK